MALLVIAEHTAHTLAESTLATVAAGQKIHQDIHLLVAGWECHKAAQEASFLKGVSKVLHVESEALAQGLAEPLGDVIVAHASAYTHLLAPASTFGKNVMPRVAALLDVSQISDVMEIESPDTFVRPIYAGNALATVQSLEAQKILTIRATTFDKATPHDQAAPIEAIDPPAFSPESSSFISRAESRSDRPDLTSAGVVVSGGRGLQSKENFQLLEKLADSLGAAIGASRAAVDAGYVSNDYQVGQTGKIVAPDLYIAVGISGAIQHLAGMKESKVIVAINKDEEAPIFQMADYGLVADLFDVLPELTERFEARKQEKRASL